jgi:hypothetical protein
MRSLDNPRSTRVFARLRGAAVGALLTLLWAGALAAQDTGAASDSTTAVAAEVAEAAGLPIFLTLGAGYGQRSDPCSLCASPDNTDSFTGHLSVGKFLGHGIGVSVDASVWKRGHPGPMVGAADSASVATATSLSNTLGNASLTFSYQLWHIYVRGGAGLAWGSQDIETTDESGDATVETASGKGIGYSAGAGLTVPLGGPVSLVFFGNWNVGRYDLSAPEGVLQRGARHEYVELGFGLTLR